MGRTFFKNDRIIQKSSFVRKAGTIVSVGISMCAVSFDDSSYNKTVISLMPRLLGAFIDTDNIKLEKPSENRPDCNDFCEERDIDVGFEYQEDCTCDDCTRIRNSQGRF